MKLNLIGNNIAAKGAKAIALNNHLNDLAIASNPIGNEGLSAIASHHSIKTLDALLIGAGIQGALALVQHLLPYFSI